MTAWLGILAVCLAVFMPGVNALKTAIRPVSTTFLRRISVMVRRLSRGLQCPEQHGSPVLVVSHHSAHADADEVTADVITAHASHGKMPTSFAPPAGSDSPASPDHGADHAAECLYCGFFTHHLPLLYSANLPTMSYGFVSRIAPQHQHASYYAQPAFVPLSRAPPILS